MKDFKSVIPEGYKAEIVDGEVIFTYVGSESKTEFNVGDLVCHECEDGHKYFAYIEGKSRGKYFVTRIIHTKTGKIHPDNNWLVLGEGRDRLANKEEKMYVRRILIENGLWFYKKPHSFIRLIEGKMYTTQSDVMVIYKGYEKGKIKAYVSYNKKSGIMVHEDERINISTSLTDIIEFEPSTIKEIETFYDVLSKNGKDWDPESKSVIDKRWTPRKFEEYWFVNSFCEPYKRVNLGSPLDTSLSKHGNVFKTHEDAKIGAEKLLDFWHNYEK